MMMGWYDNGWGSGTSGTLGMLIMAGFLVAFVALAVWAIARATRSQASVAVLGESPRTILDRRFASGEIDAEAYAQARRILEGQAPVAPGR
jgi:putative membrane protein